jgi:acyl-CoA carboxylase subunit beta
VTGRRSVVAEAPVITPRFDPESEAARANTADLLEQLAEIDGLLDQAAAGGGEQAQARLRDRGKLPIRERIATVLDPGSPFLEISPLAAATDSHYTVGGGMVAGIGVISGVECMILGNDPSVLGGALTPYVVKKWMRSLQIARENRIPYVSFVESAGADLRLDTDNAEAGRRAKTDHFAETGRFFYEMIELSKLGIPTICVVFGSSTAGGAYQPGMSDYTVFIRDRSKVFLAGPPLVKMATGEVSDDETLGGAEMHATVSGLADYLAEDELDALRICRQIVSHLNWRKAEPEPLGTAPPPRHNAEELLGIVSRDLRQSVDIREIVARVVDDSRFEEFKPSYGQTLVCGWGAIHGYPVGIVGNNGTIFPQSAEKGAQFIQLCNQVDVPLIFLQNITGFMVGRDYERDGMIKKGALLINAVSNSQVPHITITVGSSYGAGTYGMSGRAFGNRFTFLWPTARVAVMGPKQIAGVMSIVRRAQAERAGRPFDEDADRILVEQAEAVQERESLALTATSTLSDDGIIDPRDTRDVVGMCLSVCRNRPITGSRSYGVFRP